MLADSPASRSHHDLRSAESFPVQWRSNPQLGILLLALALGGVLTMVPADCRRAGALQLPALLMSFALILPTLIQLPSAPKSIFHAVNIVAAGPIYWLLLDMIQGSYPLMGISQADATHSFLAIALFSGGVWLGALLRPWRVPQSLRSGLNVRPTPRQLSTLVLIAFVLSFLRFAIPAKFDVIAMAGVFSSSRWAAPWGRGSLGGWDAFLDHFAYFGYILPVLTALMARKLGWLNPRTVIALSFTLVIAALLASGGGRRTIGVLVGSGLAVWFLSNPQVNARSMVTLGIAAGSLLFLMQVMVTFRDSGLTNAFRGEFKERMSDRHYLHVDDNFLRLSQIIQIVPDHQPYVTWKWVLWVAARPIPRVFWPGKPTDPGFNLPRYLGAKGVSYSSSVIGELYMAFGFLGCAIGGCLFGRLALSLTAMFEHHPGSGGLIVYGMGILALFAGLRSGIDLVLMSYGIVGWFVVIATYKQIFGSADTSPALSERVS